MSDAETAEGSAIAEMERVFQDDPTSLVFVDLAQAIYVQGQQKRACEVLRAGLRFHPDHVHARLLLGAFLLHRGRNRSATREMAKLLTFAPKELRAMKLLGRALLASGQSEEAWVVLRRAQETMPDDSEVDELLRYAATLASEDDDTDASGRRPPAFTGYIRSVAEAPSTAVLPSQHRSVQIDTGYHKALESRSSLPTSDDTTPLRQLPDDELPVDAVIPVPAPGDDIVPNPAQVAEAVDSDMPHPATGGGTREAMSPGIRRQLLAEAEAQLSRAAHAAAAEAARAEAAAIEAASKDDHTIPVQLSPPKAVKSTDWSPPAPVVDGPPTYNEASPLDSIEISLGDSKADLSEDSDLDALTANEAQPPSAGSMESVTDSERRSPRSVPAEVSVDINMEEPTELLAETSLTEDESQSLELTHELSHLQSAFDSGELPPTAARISPALDPDAAAQIDVSWLTKDPNAPHDRPTASEEARKPIRDASVFMYEEDDPDVLSSARPIPDAPPKSALDLPVFDWEKLDDDDSTPLAPEPTPISEPSNNTMQLPKRRSGAAAVKSEKPRPARNPQFEDSAELPATDHSAKARPSKVDLLDIPMDPDDFADMPAKPTPQPTHDVPSDLRGPNSRAAETPPSLPATPRGPIPAKKPRSAAPRAPAQPRPAPKPAPAQPKAAPRPAPAQPQAAPRPAPAPAQPKAAAEPNYDGRFGSYFDARESQIAPVPDALGDMVGEARDAAPRQGSGPVRGTRSRTWVLPVVFVLVALLAGLITWRYRATAGNADRAHAAAVDAVGDWNFESHVEVGTRLAGTELDSDPLATVGDLLVRAFGGDGLPGRWARDRALLARVEAQRTVLFGDSTRRELAVAALAEAKSLAPSAVDTHLADTLLTLDQEGPKQGSFVLSQAPDDVKATALAAFIDARIALDAGDRARALELGRLARQRDDRLIPAQALLIQLRAARGDTTVALQEYADLLDGVGKGHRGTRIARARLRIRVNKRAADAITTLREMMALPPVGLSPLQRALVHDGIGNYHAGIGEIARAREAFQAAIETMPDDPRFLAGLARLDMQAFKLDEAEGALERAQKAAPGDRAYALGLARVALRRGDAQGAIARLEVVQTPDPQVLRLRGQALYALEKFGAAERALSEASRALPTLLDVRIERLLATFRLGKQQELVLQDLKAFRGGIKADLKLEARALPFRAYAEALLATGKTKAARAEFARAAQVEPKDFEAHFGLCRAEAKLLRARPALDACQKALEANPHFRPAASLGARVAEAWRDHGAVVALLSRFKERQLSALDLRRLARALVRNKRVDDAAALIAGEEAGDAATRRYIEGFSALARGEFKTAEQALYAVTDELDQDEWAQIAYADLQLRTRRAQKAATFYRRAMQVGSEPESALGAARAAMQRRRYREALDHAGTAEKRARKSLSHPRVRGQALAIQGQALVLTGTRRDRRSAARLLRKANDIEPDLPETLLGQGLLAEAEDETAGAVARYARWAQVEPDNPEAKYRLGRLLFKESATRAEGLKALQATARLDPEGPWGERAKKLLSGGR